ncbi:MAG: SDR family oxidoreductase [Bacteroidetes bacterium]|nr:SDR family oxidoreductase [Bacteroidota bacterium]
MKKLTGKTALITGSESGIGQRIAIEYARNGANVILSYLQNESGAAYTLAEARKAGVNAFTIQADVSNEEAVQHLYKTALQSVSQIDILVNSAGVLGAGKYIHEYTFDEFKNTISANLFGTFLCCQQFVKHRMQINGPGRIINISSMHEETASPGKTDYSASKAALRGLTRCLALEVAERGITVNNIAPGLILTPMNQRAIDDEAYRAQEVKRIPAKRAGKPEDVAKLAVFLASDDADYITGTTHFIDGGFRLNRMKHFCVHPSPGGTDFS